MNSFPEDLSGRIPGFLAKLWILVDDPSTDEMISWTDEGTAFTIHDAVKFSKLLLPKFFKHASILSFVRQLNLYDFHKKVPLTSAMIEEKLTFYHAFFLRNGPGLLVEIRRKGPKMSRRPESPHLENMVSAAHELNSRHSSLVGEYRHLKQMRKAIRQSLAEVRRSLARGGAPIHSNSSKTKVVSSDGAVDDPDEVRSYDLSTAEQNSMTGLAEEVAENIELLQETNRHMVRRHKLHIQELREALQARQRLARLEEEDWKMRMQAAEQELANQELEYVVLSKQLEYQRLCNAKKKFNCIVKPVSARAAGDD